MNHKLLFSKSILDYQQLIQLQPELFSPRKYQPIITAPQIMHAFSVETGTEVGILAETPFSYFIVDVIESHPEKRLTAYQRLVSKSDLGMSFNVVVIALIKNPKLGKKNSIVTITQERHALGKPIIEIPRGGGTGNLSAQENALKELYEETGYIGSNPILLGSSYVDSGMTNSKTAFVLVNVTDYKQPRHETAEAILETKLYDLKQLKSMFIHQTVDAYTIQGVSFLEQYRPVDFL